jgi:disulfide bond formation protein DsbB
MDPAIVTKFLSWMTLLSGILLVLFLVEVFHRIVFKERMWDFPWRFLKSNYIFLAFLIAFLSTAGSLFYSEIAMYEPCKLCWLQRIFMYPLTILFAIPLFRKKKLSSDGMIFSFIMAGIGALIAGYHYLLQIGTISNVECSFVGYSVSCTETFFLNLGYITIPMMAFTAFLLIIVLGYIKSEEFV